MKPLNDMTPEEFEVEYGRVCQLHNEIEDRLEEIAKERNRRVTEEVAARVRAYDPKTNAFMQAISKERP